MTTVTVSAAIVRLLFVPLVLFSLIARRACVSFSNKRINDVLFYFCSVIQSARNTATKLVNLRLRQWPIRSDDRVNS